METTPFILWSTIHFAIARQEIIMDDTPVSWKKKATDLDQSEAGMRLKNEAGLRQLKTWDQTKQVFYNIGEMII
jgi:hypothetical protein